MLQSAFRSCQDCQLQESMPSHRRSRRVGSHPHVVQTIVLPLSSAAALAARRLHSGRPSASGPGVDLPWQAVAVNGRLRLPPLARQPSSPERPCGEHQAHAGRPIAVPSVLSQPRYNGVLEASSNDSVARRQVEEAGSAHLVFNRVSARLPALLVCLGGSLGYDSIITFLRVLDLRSTRPCWQHAQHCQVGHSLLLTTSQVAKKHLRSRSSSDGHLY
jgi:hypothetical protein